MSPIKAPAWSTCLGGRCWAVGNGGIGQWAVGSVQWGSGGQSRATIPIAVPNSFSTMAEITPTTSENMTQSSLFTKWELYASLRIVLRVMRRTVIPITKKYNNCITVCVFKHTCGARMVLAHCLIGGQKSLCRQSRERGGNLPP